jgi:predicted TIM-barrel fold metal-dependent hydrolase
MIIDVHTHIFPTEIREQRERFLSNEPAFELLYASPNSKMVGAEELVASMDAHGVDKTVTFGFPWRTADIFKRHNDYILEAVQRYPDRLIGLCCLDTEQPEAAREVERCLHAGLSGVGELAFYCSDMDCQCLGGMDAIMALARQFDCPVMVHTNEPVGHQYPGKTTNTLAQIYALVKKYPQTRLILAHWGGGIFWYNLMKREVSKTLANVWFDTAASPFLYRADIYRLAMDLAGEDKILFGTDYPLLAPKRYFDEMTQAGLQKEQKEKICGLNAAALFRIGDV